jgi:hypothetical protein
MSLCTQGELISQDDETFIKGVMIYYYNRTKEWTTNNAFYVDYIDTAKSYQPFRSHNKFKSSKNFMQNSMFHKQIEFG